MELVLNTRTIVGHDHDRATEFVRDYFPVEGLRIEWMQSPSARCVLELRPPDVGRHMEAERDLRAHLGMTSPDGAEPSGNESSGQPESALPVPGLPSAGH